MYQVNCIKCRQAYNSNEPDDFYCEDCDKQRKAIAQELDEKLKKIPPKQKPMTALEKYDAICAQRGVNAVNINDL